MDKNTTVIEKAKQYKEMVGRVLPVKIDSCWLYGSYAKGTQKPHSDIDIAIEVNHIDDDLYWTVLPVLWKFSYQIDSRIEPVLIARDTDYTGFLDEIQRTGIKIM
ncbi:MAG: nucleotidyltransferase domain-containing protein [Tannerella sp.]|jgi:predicted nucleotidyltransferase|nr:nucleotidyltransferase domain-containing protein [Tannerella sp.]